MDSECGTKFSTRIPCRGRCLYQRQRRMSYCIEKWKREDMGMRPPSYLGELCSVLQARCGQKALSRKENIAIYEETPNYLVFIISPAVH